MVMVMVMVMVIVILKAWPLAAGRRHRGRRRRVAFRPVP